MVLAPRPDEWLATVFIGRGSLIGIDGPRAPRPFRSPSRRPRRAAVNGAMAPGASGQSTIRGAPINKNLGATATDWRS